MVVVMGWSRPSGSMWLTWEACGWQAKLDAGVYTLHDMRVMCRKSDKHWCPYYLARHMMAFANVVVYNYQYMLDPKVLPSY